MSVQLPLDLGPGPKLQPRRRHANKRSHVGIDEGAAMPRDDTDLLTIFDTFPDEAAAARWFEHALWGNTRACGHCGSERTRLTLRAADAVLVLGLPPVLLGSHRHPPRALKAPPPQVGHRLLPCR